MYSWVTLACLIQAILFPGIASADLGRREEVALARKSCNTASNRACWAEGFNINTDWEVKTPVTGITRTASIPDSNNYCSVLRLTFLSTH